MTAIDPIQRLRAEAAIDLLRTGRHTIDLECEHCHRNSIYPDTDPQDPEPQFTCAACGRKTAVSKAKAVRVEKIKAFISEGADLDLKKLVKQARR